MDFGATATGANTPTRPTQRPCAPQRPTPTAPPRPQHLHPTVPPRPQCLHPTVPMRPTAPRAHSASTPQRPRAQCLLAPTGANGRLRPTAPCAHGASVFTRKWVCQGLQSGARSSGFPLLPKVCPGPAPSTPRARGFPFKPWEGESPDDTGLPRSGARGITHSQHREPADSLASASHSRSFSNSSLTPGRSLAAPKYL